MRYFSLVLLLVSARLAAADVVPHPLFGEGAVLQRDRIVPVWGAAAEGERVRVSIQKQVRETVCRDGRWRVELEPLAAGGPFELQISGGEKEITRQVWVGDVWLASGQSNMDLTVVDCDRAAEEIAAADHPEIHFCKVPRQAADELPQTLPVKWQVCTPKTVGNISGVGYFFARDLQPAVKVPVGLIDAAYGSTPAEAWMSPAAIRSRPEFQSILDEYAEQVKDSPRAMAEYEAKLREWQKAAALPRTPGAVPPPKPQLPLGPYNWRRPSGTYFGMIAPLAPFPIRGVIWYQGERNTPRAAQYRTLFPALIADWRRLFGQPDLPFLFVQLAPFGKPPSTPRESTWAELREAQLLTSQTVPHTAMAVITDVGDPADIHPKRKQAVGTRLALAARAVAYGEQVEYRGPTYRALEIRDDRALVSFDHVAGGLICRGDELRGFAVCGADGKFVNAQAKIVGERVEAWSPEVKKPVAVRYGWAEYPEVNLEDGAGLPASPFRTDGPKEK